MLRKETTTRTFQNDGKDWIDTSTAELAEAHNALVPMVVEQESTRRTSLRYLQP